MNQTFEAWKADVDRWLRKLCGTTSDGIPDWDYWNAWQSRYTPEAAARGALEAGKEF